MNNLRTINLFSLGIILMPVVAIASLPGNDKREFTDEFTCPGGVFVNSTATGAANQYFPLTVGSISYLSNQACVDDGECDELEEVTITVMGVEEVDSIFTRVVEEFEEVDGETAEVSLNFYAECEGTGDVYYFGEDVEDGDGNSLPDGWRAGVEGAMPGLIMPGGTFLIGSRYFQEVAADIALDRGENAAMGLSITVPAGTFTDCVQINDTNALEDPKGKGFDEKIYCPGVGIVMDEELELISITP